MSTFCVNCGPKITVDEDGCCFACGADATGPWADRVVALIDELRKTVETDEDGYCGIYAGEALAHAAIVIPLPDGPVEDAKKRVVEPAKAPPSLSTDYQNYHDLRGSRCFCQQAKPRSQRGVHCERCGADGDTIPKPNAPCPIERNP